MNVKQHTLKGEFTLSGVGLHTGENTTLTFKPAPPHHGVVFKRVDLPNQPTVEADVDYVVDLSRGTTLEKNGARVATVEHVLAALTGMQVDNVLLELDGPEMPIMDGSSLHFIEAIQGVGLEEQNAARDIFEVDETIFYKDPERDVELAALPNNDYRVTVMIDYKSKVLGSQHSSITSLDQFAQEIASARTFCFLHELEALHDAGLIKGGNMNNAIVVVDRKVEAGELANLQKIFENKDIQVAEEGILNNVELRYKNEPARHKLLDLVGDLSLAGRPIKAQIMAARPGHAANVAFAKKVKSLMKKKSNSAVPNFHHKMPAVLDSLAIQKALPHRYPFQLIDKVFHLEEKSVGAVKSVTINEPFFQGHFPGNPVMPGVLIIEAMAQTGGILVLFTVPDPENYWTYFLGIENARFRKPVVPGDTLVLKCELTAPIKRGIAKMKGLAYVGDTLVCEANMTASIVRK